MTISGGDTLTSFAASRTQEVPIFFDMLPIITNAAKAAVRVLEPEIEVLSMEGRDFLAHFKGVGEVDMAVQHFRLGTFEI